MRLVTSLLLLVVLLCSTSASLAQQRPPLERMVSLDIKETAITVILDSIARQSSIIFSYSTNLSQFRRKASVQVTNKSVREVLIMLFGQTLQWKQKDNYIILTAAKKDSRHVWVRGYVYDRESDQRLPYASVFEENSLAASVSDEYGYYEFRVPRRKADNLRLNVDRLEYRDTMVLVEKAPVQIPLDLLVYPDSSRKDSMRLDERWSDLRYRTSRWFGKLKGSLHTQNLNDTLHRNFQFSLVPYVGTNHKLSGRIVNRFSFNLIGGYSDGNTIAELGGAFNINRRIMGGAQIAGAANIVGDTVSGVQIAGAVNLTGKHAEGVQIAGGTNINQGSMRGVQIAGGLNLNEDTAAAVMISGGVNLQRQLISGAQIAGGVNLAGTMRGIQIAGGYNHADTLKGMQISGGVNSAGFMAGVQIGLINIADTSTGFPLGLFSYVRSGRHQLEIAADENFLQNISFRTGTRRFYNILSVGANLHESGPLLWHFGYGIGTGFPLGKRFTLEFDISAHHISRGSFSTTLSETGKASLMLEYRIAKKFALAAGPVLNGFFYGPRNSFMTFGFLPADREPGDYVSYSHYNEYLGNGVSFTGWVGGKVALRFF